MTETPASETTGSRTWVLVAIGLVVVAVAGLVTWYLIEGDGEKDRGRRAYKVQDYNKVYYGNPRVMRRPAVVRLATVYAQIPEYQQIRSQRLGENDPKYHLLMRTVSEKFGAAVKAGRVWTFRRSRSAGSSPSHRTGLARIIHHEEHEVNTVTAVMKKEPAPLVLDTLPL